MLPRTSGAGGAVMPVRDVERGHRAKRGDQLALVVRGHPPHGVLHAINGGEVEQRRRPDRALHRPVNAGRRLVNQEHRPGLRPQLDDVARPIVLLVAARALVFLDDVAVVVVHGKGAGDPGLKVRSHTQPVDVQGRRVLEHQRRPRLEGVEILHRLRIHRVVIWVGVGREVDFRARHVQEAERIPGRQRACLVGVDDIVGNSGDGGC
jgi:hypothetical protein